MSRLLFAYRSAFFLQLVNVRLVVARVIVEALVFSESCCATPTHAGISWTHFIVFDSLLKSEIGSGRLEFLVVCSFG